MIAWMQKHNKYLVITIWIATIAFIGAGFVGWGTYSYGSKTSSIAQVGDVEIYKEKFDFVYTNIYNDLANRMRGDFDDEKAKELGLINIAYEQLKTQALLLNLAKEYGVVVSDDELAKEIASNPIFIQNGKFSKKIYNIFLRGRGMKAKAFEKIVRDDMVVKKLMEMLNLEAVDYEVEMVASTIGLRDKIKFSIIKPSDIGVEIDDKELKLYWEKRKERFKTDKMYKLAIHWTDTDKIDVGDDELMKFYQKNSYNYLDKNGTELPFKDVKEKVLKDYRIKKGKKRALLERIAIKKGKITLEKSQEIAINSPILSKELWEMIESSKKGTLLKPKVVGNRYATVKILDVIQPRMKSFDEARESASKELKTIKLQKLLDKRAEEILSKTESELKLESGFITVVDYKSIPNLDSGQRLVLARAIFSSSSRKGIVKVGESRVVFKIVKQDKGAKQSRRLSKSLADNLKSKEFRENLIKELSNRYSVKTFVKVKGL